MAANPRMVKTNLDVTYQGVTIRAVAGTIIDCPPGSAMETAYGTGNLASLGTQDALSMSNGAGATAGGS